MSFTTVKELTTYLQNLEFDQTLDRSFFENMALLYQQSTFDEASEIVDQLSKSINIRREVGRQLLVQAHNPARKEEALKSLVEIDRFCRQELQKLRGQHPILRNDLRLDAILGLQRQKWVDVYQDVQKYRIQRFTRPFLFSKFATPDPEELRDKQPQRRCAVKAKSKKSDANTRPKKRRRINEIDPTLVIPTPTTPRSRAIAEEYNIAERPITPCTPNGKNPDLFRTPTRTNIYRSAVREDSRTLIYKRKTPIKQTVTREVPANHSENSPYYQKICNFTVTRFCVAPPPRPRHSQNALMHERARNRLEQESFQIDKNSGDYAWSHIIGLCLGGPHVPDNIIPATGSANRNMYHLIEKPIRDLFKVNNINKLEMETVLEFEVGCSVPVELTCNLKWDAPQQDGTTKPNTKTIPINPRTLVKASQALRRATAAFFQSSPGAKPQEEKSQEPANSPPSPIKS